MLSYPQLLDRAIAETERLTTLAVDLETELFQMSVHYLKSGWNKGFSDYYAQRREVKTQLDIATMHLGDSRGRVLYLRKEIAAGKVREAVAVAQAA